jgi:hypothetical protein
MPLTLDVHPLKSRIGDFVAGLKALEKESITSAKVLEYLTQMQPSAEALSPKNRLPPITVARPLIQHQDPSEVRDIKDSLKQLAR